MNFKRVLAVLAVQFLAEKTTIVRKSSTTEDWVHTMFGIETEEQRLARGIEETLDQATETVKRAKVNREFKKITRNM